MLTCCSPHELSDRSTLKSAVSCMAILVQTSPWTLNLGSVPIYGFYRDNAKENGKYYIIIGYILGLVLYICIYI